MLRSLPSCRAPAAPRRRLRPCRGQRGHAARAAGPADAPPAVGEGAEGRQVLFNNIAPVYDTLNDLLSLGQHRVWKQATVQWCRASAGGTVLDVCCGSGDIALRLAEAVGGSGRVTGLDFAAAQLEVAARREAELLAAPGASERRARVEWVEGDACALPFPDASFDAATCGYGLRNVVDIPGALAQLRRVLRPGATAALLDFNRPDAPFAAAAQRALLDNVVVPVARAAGVAQEYEYLVPSIAAFPTGREQVALARSAGFAHAVHYELAGGLMGVLVATKGAES